MPRIHTLIETFDNTTLDWIIFQFSRSCKETPMKQIKETDLYPPLKSWLETNGYEVHAEVGHCDIAAVKNGNLVLIEMKRAINLELLLQTARRQRLKAAVYAAVPSPRVNNRAWRERARLLRRLEIGLIVVNLHSARPSAQLLFHPAPYTPRKNKAKTQTLLSEIAGRSKDLNTGGSLRTKLHTAYREEAITVAVALNALGPTSPKNLKNAGTSRKTNSILQANHYGWFNHLAVGLYSLNDKGKQALVENADLVICLRERLTLEKEQKTP